MRWGREAGSIVFRLKRRERERARDCYSPHRKHGIRVLRGFLKCVWWPNSLSSSPISPCCLIRMLHAYVRRETGRSRAVSPLDLGTDPLQDEPGDGSDGSPGERDPEYGWRALWRVVHSHKSRQALERNAAKKASGCYTFVGLCCKASSYFEALCLWEHPACCERKIHRKDGRTSLSSSSPVFFPLNYCAMPGLKLIISCQVASGFLFRDIGPRCLAGVSW